MNNNIKFVDTSIYEATYTVKSTQTGFEYEHTMLINADNFEEAKNHLFAAIENDTIRILGYKIQQRTLWKIKKEGIPFSDLMPVICLDSGLNPAMRGRKGEKYFIQRSSIYMDPDGTAYGQLYEDNEGKVLLANVKLDRFMSI